MHTAVCLLGVETNALAQTLCHTELGFQVVGAAMEAMTGRKFQSLVREYITNPLGMDSTEVGCFFSRPD